MSEGEVPEVKVPEVGFPIGTKVTYMRRDHDGSYSKVIGTIKEQLYFVTEDQGLYKRPPYISEYVSKGRLTKIDGGGFMRRLTKKVRRKRRHYSRRK